MIVVLLEVWKYLLYLHVARGAHLVCNIDIHVFLFVACILVLRISKMELLRYFCMW